jgi:hypothetical protein
VTEQVNEQLRERYEFERRDVIAVKGKGDMQTYFLERSSPGPGSSTT